MALFVKEADVKLNAFGSVFGTLELTEAMRLGEYNVTFENKEKNENIGSAMLFRLEEYWQTAGVQSGSEDAGGKRSEEIVPIG